MSYEMPAAEQMEATEHHWNIAAEYVASLRATNQHRKSYWYCVVFNEEGEVIGHVPQRNQTEAHEAADQQDGLQTVVISGRSV